MTLCTIIGMGPGIGLSVAKRFAKEGFDIFMIARSSQHLQQYSHFLKAEYPIKSSSFVADAGEFKQLESALTQIKNSNNPIDVLVYNAAVLKKTDLLSLTPQEFMAHYQVNVGGALVAVQQVIPDMEKRGRGTILFTGGGFANQPSPNYVSLSIGKAALQNLALNLAKEYEPKGIHVAIVNIYGKVQSGTAYDPQLIAQQYWQLHTQAPQNWQREVHIK